MTDGRQPIRHISGRRANTPRDTPPESAPQFRHNSKALPHTRLIQTGTQPNFCVGRRLEFQEFLVPVVARRDRTVADLIEILPIASFRRYGLSPAIFRNVNAT